MSQEPLNPYQHYDKAPDDYLEENLKKRLFERDSYKKWTERVEEEIRYIQHIQNVRKGNFWRNKNG
jgi:hypothetical protein